MSEATRSGQPHPTDRALPPTGYRIYQNEALVTAQWQPGDKDPSYTDIGPQPRRPT